MNWFFKIDFNLKIQSIFFLGILRIGLWLVEIKFSGLFKKNMYIY